MMIPSKLIPPPPTSLHDYAGAQAFSALRNCPQLKAASSPSTLPSSSIYPRKVEFVCSYSCVEHPSIVPGSEVTGPEAAPRLQSPLEPVLRAVLDKHPEYSFSSLDLITSRNALRDLFELISTSGTPKKSPGELKFYVEFIRPAQDHANHLRRGRGTVLLQSGNLEGDDTAAMEDGVGDDHGAEFLEHHSSALIADNFEKFSMDEAKIVTYDFAGMQCMVKYTPKRGLNRAPGKQNTPSHDVEDDGKCRRVRKKTKIRNMNNVSEWMRKVPHVSSSSYGNNDEINHHHIGIVENTHPVIAANEKSQVAEDVEKWRLEQDDQLANLRSEMRQLKVYNPPNIEVDDQYDDVPGESKSVAPYLALGHHNRQRGDSVSSTSSALSQASTRSMVSSRSSVSCALGENPHFYHTHKRLHLLPTIASTPPNEVNVPVQHVGFDTPLSNLWYKTNLSPSLFDVEAIEPDESEDHHEDSVKHQGVVMGKYRSTARYQSVLKAWEKEHVENLRKLVGVLRKIKKAAEKTGRCKVVVESSGKIRPYRVKQSEGEKEVEFGRVSILSKDLLEQWT